MGVGGEFDSQKRGSRGFKGLMRRKLVDSARKEVDGGHKLAKELSVTHLIAIGNPFSFLGSFLNFLGRWIFHGFLIFILNMESSIMRLLDCFLNFCFGDYE